MGMGSVDIAPWDFEDNATGSVHVYE